MVDLGLIGGAVVALVIAYIVLRALYNGTSAKLVKTVDYLADVALTTSASWSIENSADIDTNKIKEHKKQIKALLEE